MRAIANGRASLPGHSANWDAQSAESHGTRRSGRAFSPLPASVLFPLVETVQKVRGSGVYRAFLELSREKDRGVHLLNSTKVVFFFFTDLYLNLVIERN